MRRIFTIVLLVLMASLTQGCFTTAFLAFHQGNYDLGSCRYSHTGSNICLVKVPKNRSGVTLIAKRDVGVGAGWNGELKLRLKNVDVHPVEISTFDRDTITRLIPGESVEVTTKSAVTSEAYVGFLDTSESGVKLAIQITAAGLAEEEVSLVGHVAAL